MCKFELNDTNKQIIIDVCKANGNSAGNVIHVLHGVQGKLGYLPAEVQEFIAKQLNIPVSKVYGIVSFYSFFTMTPKGKYPIDVCLGTACHVRGSDKLLEEFRRQLGIGEGQTTEDGLFSLSTLRCVGACSLAPVAMIGERVFGRLTPNQVAGIIAEYRDK
ncbi:MAG: NAD(P)H-dependent oxidoreductase subunit E [Bacteroidales bacterium]|jgi:NADH-quinone oxidoreductase subunit E/NADP-reducing hydrogenase subunit HndA|nr:NAD(P)H-dependent oxidoreductase subunit E [Bacteroidales bacterium]